jgi:hypothetical protein
MMLAKPSKRGPKPRRPIARSARPPRQSRSRAAVARRKADAAWSFDVRWTAGDMCEFNWCKRVADDAHHLWPKSTHRKLRHESLCGVALCRTHHQQAHRQMDLFRLWFSNAFPLRWAALEKLKAMEAS